MIKSLSVILIILISNSIHAQKIISSTISFTIKNAGVKVNGAFQLEDATIKFNPEDLSNSAMSGSVNVNSIDTGIGLRDKHLKKEDYFDADNHPLIILTSKTIKRKDANSFEGVFNLTIKGISKAITIPFEVNKSDENHTTYSGEFQINRLDFKVGSNSWVMSDDVNVIVTIVTKSQN